MLLHCYFSISTVLQNTFYGQLPELVDTLIFRIKAPHNAFNGLKTIREIWDGEEFPSQATGNYNWIYQANTKTVKLDWPATDSSGVPYIHYGTELTNWIHP